MAELSGDRRLSEIFRQYGQLKKYNPGQLLIEKGQPAAYSCYLASGYARTFCINSAGDDITLFYIEPDNLICSESLLLDATVQVSVEAISPAEMYLLPGSELLRLWSERGWGVQELMRPLPGKQQEGGVFPQLLLYADRGDDPLYQRADR